MTDAQATIRRIARRPARRDGLVLYAVLVLVAMSALVGASLMFRMQAESAAASAGVSGRQARLTAMTGIQRVAALLSAEDVDPTLLVDDEELFRNQLVYDDGQVQWYFTVFAPSETEAGEICYGITDESAKININTADADTLLALPNMTEELVDCLLDYRDDDDDPSPAGAEQAYYSRLACPYAIRNGSLKTLEELLLVKGFHAGVVFGEDANANGVLDVNEDDGDDSFPPDDGNGELDTGLTHLATALTYELSASGGDSGKVNINGGLSAMQEAGLPAQTLQYITAYRTDGGVFGDPSELLDAVYTPADGGASVDSGVGPDELDTIMSLCVAGDVEPLTEGLEDELFGEDPLDEFEAEMATGRRRTPNGRRFQRAAAAAAAASGGSSDESGVQITPRMGLVNVNTASAEVLAAMGAIGLETAHRIVDRRSELDPEQLTSTSWLVNEDVLDAEQFRKVSPMLTTTSYQYRVRCVGFGSPIGQFCVLEAVIDLALGQPRIMYMRDVTRLGQPFAFDVESDRL